MTGGPETHESGEDALGWDPMGYLRHRSEERRLVGYTLSVLVSISLLGTGVGTPHGVPPVSPRSIVPGFMRFRTRTFKNVSIDSNITKFYSKPTVNPANGTGGDLDPCLEFLLPNLVCYKLKIHFWDSEKYGLRHF